MRKMIGIIYKKIDDNNGYIIAEDSNLYLFNDFDIIDDTKIEEGIKVVFKPLNGKVLKATYISKYEE